MRDFFFFQKHGDPLQQLASGLHLCARELSGGIQSHAVLPQLARDYRALIWL